MNLEEVIEISKLRVLHIDVGAIYTILAILGGRIAILDLA